MKHLLLVTLFSLCSVSFSASLAWADEYVVILLEDAFFPQKVNVKQGDTVRFVNESGYESEITHVQGKWATPPIPAGGELLVTITPDMTGTFQGHTGQKIVGYLNLIRSGTAD